MGRPAMGRRIHAIDNAMRKHAMAGTAYRDHEKKEGNSFAVGPGFLIDGAHFLKTINRSSILSNVNPKVR